MPRIPTKKLAVEVCVTQKVPGDSDSEADPAKLAGTDIVTNLGEVRLQKKRRSRGIGICTSTTGGPALGRSGAEERARAVRERHPPPPHSGASSAAQRAAHHHQSEVI